MLFPSDTEEEKQCGDEAVVTNVVHTLPAMIVLHSSELLTSIVVIVVTNFVFES